MAATVVISRPFLAGAATALALVLVQREVCRFFQTRAKNTQRTSPSTIQQEKRQSSTSNQDYCKNGRVDKNDVVDSNHDDDAILLDSPDLDLRLIRKAEAVIQKRTSSVIIVVERCTNDHNYSAILRTAEALGIQHVWLIDPVRLDSDGKSATAIPLSPEEMEQREMHRLFAQNASEWLTIRHFRTTKDCLIACREAGFSVWVTDLSQEATPLTEKDLKSKNTVNNRCNWPLPEKLAIVFGTEAVGCSQEMLKAADLRVYYPLYGFADSLNLSVATALVIQQVLSVLHPAYIGSMSAEERLELRKAWFPKLAQQRLLTSNSKKKRRLLLNKIHACEQLQAKIDAGETLTAGQLEKLGRLSEYQKELKSIEEQANYHAAADVVADLIGNPPRPLSDVRRPDIHRVTFVGKNTKRTNQEHWKDMVATNTAVRTEKMSTALFFRERLSSLTRIE